MNATYGIFQVHAWQLLVMAVIIIIHVIAARFYFANKALVGGVFHFIGLLMMGFAAFSLWTSIDSMHVDIVAIFFAFIGTILLFAVSLTVGTRFIGHHEPTKIKPKPRR